MVAIENFKLGATGVERFTKADTTAGVDDTDNWITDIDSVSNQYSLEYISIHFSSAATTTLTVEIIDGGTGFDIKYNYTIISDALVADTDYFFNFAGMRMNPGDEVRVRMTGTGGAYVASCKVVYNYTPMRLG